MGDSWQEKTNARIQHSNASIDSALASYSSNRKRSIGIVLEDFVGICDVKAYGIRERGGLDYYLEDYTRYLAQTIHELVKTYQDSNRLPDLTFVNILLYIFADRKDLFIFAFNWDYLNPVKNILCELKPILDPLRFHYFYADFMVFLRSWKEENFARELILGYKRRILDLLIQYQSSELKIRRNYERNL